MEKRSNEVQCRVINLARPTLRLQGKSQTYIDTAFELALRSLEMRLDGQKRRTTEKKTGHLTKAHRKSKLFNTDTESNEATEHWIEIKSTPVKIKDGELQDSIGRKIQGGSKNELSRNSGKPEERRIKESTKDRKSVV
jgi:hypothetical protein